MDANPAADVALPRRTKWLLALLLCPLCGLGLLLSVGGFALTGITAALLAYNGAILWSLGVVAVGTAGAFALWRRNRACAP